MISPICSEPRVLPHPDSATAAENPARCDGWWGCDGRSPVVLTALRCQDRHLPKSDGGSGKHRAPLGQGVPEVHPPRRAGARLRAGAGTAASTSSSRSYGALDLTEL